MGAGWLFESMNVMTFLKCSQVGCRLSVTPLINFASRGRSDDNHNNDDGDNDDDVDDILLSSQ